MISTSGTYLSLYDPWELNHCFPQDKKKKTNPFAGASVEEKYAGCNCWFAVDLTIDKGRDQAAQKPFLTKHLPASALGLGAAPKHQ